MRLFGIGTLLNFLVIAFNGFRMPVLMQLQEKMGPEVAERLKAGEIFGYALARTDSPLLFLGDVFLSPFRIFTVLPASVIL